ncbi:amino acid ABC transporter permease [Arthrobacter sp. AQ5-05]|uniref:amino acid ABC transporter permease n=1 Tax=Arthrobacter sp. AQ5-05 TaxID=2184581 RepID=UPI001C661574|nr:amino acid ABC transporter permease [Arthrobacter sp. AQ5-05]
MINVTPTQDTYDARLQPPQAQPPAVVPLTAASVIVVILTAVTSFYALAWLYAYMYPQPAGAFTKAVFVVLWLATWLPLLPTVQALRSARKSRNALQDNGIVIARHHAALGRESALTSLGYSVAIVVLALLVAFVSTNDGAIARTFLRPEFIAQAWSDVLRAFWVNVQVAIGAEVLVLVLGLVIAIMRMLPGRAGRPLRFLAVLYTDVFRAIPGIIVLYLVGFGLSLAEVPFFKDLPPIVLAIFALTLTYSAYVAEVYRAGLDSIHRSQWAAARSLGLSYPQALRTVIIPQAVRRVIPPLLNDFIGLQKDTALIGVMGVIDAFTQSRLVGSAVFNLSPVTVVAIVFVLITIPQSRFVDRMIEKDQARQRSGSN